MVYYFFIWSHQIRIDFESVEKFVKIRNKVTYAFNILAQTKINLGMDNVFFLTYLDDMSNIFSQLHLAVVATVVIVVVLVAGVMVVVVTGVVDSRGSRCCFPGWLWFQVLLWLQVVWLWLKVLLLPGLTLKPFHRAWDYTFDDGHNRYSHEYKK